MKEIILFYPRPWPGETMSGRLPYSLLYLTGYLLDTDFKVSIIDERTAEDLTGLIKGLKKDNIVCFGISSFTGIQIKNGLGIARQLKLHHPGVPIVWGGWHPSTLPEQTLEHPLVDIVVRGQGEATFKELVFALAEGKDLAGISGISYKLDDKIVRNPDRELLPVIEKLKVPLATVDVEKYVYKKPFAERSGRTIGIITSLGCPNFCGFCAVASIYKQRVFFRDLDNVLSDIDYLVEKYNINGITIDDDNFFVSPARVNKFCEGLLKRPYKIAWDAGVSVNLLKHYDDKFLKLIKQSGCEQLYIGAESGSDAVLRLINKKATVEQTYDFVRKMKEIGIKASLSSMVGIPGSSPDEIFDTMNMIFKCRQINPNFDYRIFYYTPYPGTTLYKSAIKNGLKEPSSLEDWAGHTLRRFKAPWVKASYRKLVKYFYFYYFPYSGDMKRTGNAIYSFFFENALLRGIARWRVKHGCYKLPIDALYVTQGLRIRSLYGRLVHKNIDVFQEFDN